MSRTLLTDNAKLDTPNSLGEGLSSHDLKRSVPVVITLENGVKVFVESLGPKCVRRLLVFAEHF